MTRESLGFFVGHPTIEKTINRYKTPFTWLIFMVNEDKHTMTMDPMGI